MSVERNKYKPKPAFLILGYVAVIMYLGIGVYLLAKPGVLGAYAPSVQTTLGIILLVYGVFRLYIVVQRQRWIKKQQEQSNEE